MSNVYTIPGTVETSWELDSDQIGWPPSEPGAGSGLGCGWKSACGGLEPAGVAEVTARSFDTRDRQRSPSSWVKALGGTPAREADICQRLVAALGGGSLRSRRSRQETKEQEVEPGPATRPAGSNRDSRRLLQLGPKL
jgi:hypothetical protein